MLKYIIYNSYTKFIFIHYIWLLWYILFHNEKINGIGQKLYNIMVASTWNYIYW